MWTSALVGQKWTQALEWSLHIMLSYLLSCRNYFGNKTTSKTLITFMFPGIQKFSALNGLYELVGLALLYTAGLPLSLLLDISASPPYGLVSFHGYSEV